jgi:periplasmic protein TonB
MFDRYAAATAPSWGRRALIMASILLHVTAGIALAIYSIFHIEEIAPPAISLTFFSAPPPPPPPPAGHKKTTPHTEIKKPVTQIVQPKPDAIFQPKKEEPKPEEKDEEGEEGGVEGGVKCGVAGGTVGGVVGSTGKPTGGKTVPMFTLMASVISAPDPHLPDEFKAQHPNQTVKGMYKVCLNTDGSIADVTTMTPVPGQDGTIISQVKSSWKYKPQPLPVCFVKPFLFKIN